MTMRRFEYVIPVDFWAAKEILETEATFLRRSKIEDSYFEDACGHLARLRKQDTITRLSCTSKAVVDEIADAHETVVLDHRATEAMLGMLGFSRNETVRLTRDSFRMHHYAIALDRVEGLGDFLVLETEAGTLEPARLRHAAERFIGKLEIPLKGLPGTRDSGLDSFSPLPYTRAIGIAE